MYKSEYIFMWKIEKFSFCHQKNGDCLRSPAFKMKNLKDLSGWLMLYPRGENDKYSKFISCSLQLYSEDAIDFLQCEINAIGASGKILKVHKWKEFSNERIDTYLKCPDFLAIKDVVQDLEDCMEDTLSICCKFYGRNSNQSVLEEDIACTKIDVNRHTFQMIVHKKKTKEYLFALGPNTKFSLTIAEKNDTIKVTVSRLISAATNVETCVMDCTLTLVDNNQYRIYSERAKHYFSSVNCLDWKFPSDILSKEWGNYRNQNLVYYINIYCEFSVSNGTHFEIDVPKSKLSSVPSKRDKSLSSSTINATAYNSLQEDLLTLFHSKKLSDRKLRVGDETVEAHKNVLVARSPVFAVMFDHQDMEETRSGIVGIENIDVQTLKLFLHFLYTDTVDEMDYEVTTKLLIAADKYQVLSLKEKCAMFLKNEMSVDNVCELSSLADAVNHENLKSASIEFIIANSATVLSSPQWIPWMENNMKSATSIFAKLTQSHSSSTN